MTKNLTDWSTAHRCWLAGIAAHLKSTILNSLYCRHYNIDYDHFSRGKKWEMEPDLIACYAIISPTRSSNTIPLETQLKLNKIVRYYLLPLTKQLRQLRAWVEATQAATRTRRIMALKRSSNCRPVTCAGEAKLSVTINAQTDAFRAFYKCSW